MYLEMGGKRGKIGGSRLRNKEGFSILGGDNFLCFLG
jgi:hypothetical protein